MALELFLLAHGDPCPPRLLRSLRRGRFTIVLDGAAEAVRKYKWVPHMIAGDFDSVSAATLRHFANKGSQLLRTPDQNFSDLEKALQWGTQRNAKSIWIAQALGQRLDQSFVTLSLLKRFHDSRRELFLFHGRDRVRFARNQKLRLAGKKGRLLAVLPFPECRVSSRGLAYEMKKTKLALGQRESSSNRARVRVVQLEIRGEALVVEQMA